MRTAERRARAAEELHADAAVPRDVERVGMTAGLVPRRLEEPGPRGEIGDVWHRVLPVIVMLAEVEARRRVGPQPAVDGRLRVGELQHLAVPARRAVLRLREGKDADR